MHKKRLKTIAIYLLAGGLATWLILCGCEKKILPSQQGPKVRVALSFRPAFLSGNVSPSEYRLTVEASDMEPIQTPLSPRNGVLTCEIDVPAGADRHFTAEALGPDAVLYFWGEAYTDVVADSTIELIIMMEPTIPMMVISPHYQAVVLGDTFGVVVDLFNVLDLSEIQFTVAYNGTDDLIFLDSVRMGGNLIGAPVLSTVMRVGEVDLTIHQRETSFSFIGPSGMGTLARLFFHTASSTPLSRDAAEVRAIITYLQDTNADSIPVVNVPTDIGVVELYKLPDGDTLNSNYWHTTFGTQDDEWGYAIDETADGQIIIAGQKYIPGSGWDIYAVKVDSLGRLQWSRNYGGINNDLCRDVVATNDGGQILAGWTALSGGVGNEQACLFKIDPFGNIIWQKSYGASGLDRFSSVLSAVPSGYLAVGITNRTSVQGSDFYVVRADEAGEIVWEKVHHFNSNDELTGAVAIPEGGYLVVGVTGIQSLGVYDLFAARLDANGEIVWQNTYGGDQLDWAMAVAASPGDGFVICGYTYSFGSGGADIYLIKINSAGGLVWQKTIGGPDFDRGNAIINARDGGYLIAGTTGSFGAGNGDLYLVHIDEDGNQVWAKPCGGSLIEEGFGIVQTMSGSIFITGASESFGGGGYDLYLVKTTDVGTRP